MYLVKLFDFEGAKDKLVLPNLHPWCPDHCNFASQFRSHQTKFGAMGKNHAHTHLTQIRALRRQEVNLLTSYLNKDNKVHPVFVNGQGQVAQSNH